MIILQNTDYSVILVPLFEKFSDFKLLTSTVWYHFHSVKYPKG